MYVCASNEPKTELVKSKVYNLQPPARMDSVSTLHLWLEVRFGGRVLGWRRRLRGRRGLGGGGRRLSGCCQHGCWVEVLSFLLTHFLEFCDCHGY